MDNFFRRLLLLRHKFDRLVSRLRPDGTHSRPATIVPPGPLCGWPVGRSVGGGPVGRSVGGGPVGRSVSKQKFLASVVIESWCTTSVITKNLSLKLLRGASIRACSADCSLGLYGCVTIPPLVTVAPVLVYLALDVLQVAPPFASFVSGFAVAIQSAKFVSEDLTLTLTKAVFNGKGGWSPNTNFLARHHACSHNCAKHVKQFHRDVILNVCFSFQLQENTPHV